MSVLIKDMNIPKSCSDCPLNYNEMSCAVTGTRWWSDTMVLLDFDYTKERLHDCPLSEVPSAQPERKNDDLILVKGSKGEWILVKGSNGKDYHKCSECLHTQEITGVKNYCAVCGAEMVGKQNE